MFRQGMHDLKVWPGVEGDGSEPTSTPGRTSSTLTEDQMGRLAKVSRWIGEWRSPAETETGEICLWTVTVREGYVK